LVHTDVTSKKIDGNVLDIAAAHLDVAILGIVESEEEAEYSRRRNQAAFTYPRSSAREPLPLSFFW
jgi:hypothetical protein